ncbi:hypothetical protein CSE64_001875 [Escherichia coli]|nr:hypothetical protein [Escherichia coli]EFC6241879.1 hypothetical protein [Escherichia coli]
MSLHSLDGYLKTMQAPKSVAQSRREEFQQKLEAAANHIADKLPDLILPVLENVADELQSEMPEDMEGTAKQRLEFELSRRLKLPISAFRK